jgi:hypothetical protein
MVAGCRRPAERLLLIDLVCVHGVVVMQSIWATSADLRAGGRETRTETIREVAVLRRRLDQLVPLLFAESRAPVPKRAAAA